MYVSDECEPLCDFCINFDSDKWECKLDGSERFPSDDCEKFVCSICSKKNE